MIFTDAVQFTQIMRKSARMLILGPTRPSGYNRRNRPRRLLCMYFQMLKKLYTCALCFTNFVCVLALKKINVYNVCYV